MIKNVSHTNLFLLIFDYIPYESESGFAVIDRRALHFAWQNGIIGAMDIISKSEKKASKKPKVSDSDLDALRAEIALKKENRRKQNITLRLSPDTIDKAKSLGKGYSTILSRIVESALDDPEFLRKCL